MLRAPSGKCLMDLNQSSCHVVSIYCGESGGCWDGSIMSNLPNYDVGSFNLIEPCQYHTSYDPSNFFLFGAFDGNIFSYLSYFSFNLYQSTSMLYPNLLNPYDKHV
ncbi:hypothetical protein POPTR_012G100450v4 [Populus trichocarpa]|jgi:hypothetical protein|uniref:Uncharacterized protein n=1 Tax=Populus trichocarpa TaxID=3694 RepID=A0ACC0S772_POPTR|nr:hypothetical protein POPTR_012G100450v4 [Populus trichocarpa]